jgi:isocitrate dehydrogenase
MNYALARKYPLYLSTKNTIIKAYDGRFKDCSKGVRRGIHRQIQIGGLTYEHRLIRRHGVPPR